MSLSAGANERMRILANGNVGIGTTSPSAKLDIIGANSNSEAIELFGDSTYGATIGYSRGGSYSWRAGIGGTGSTSSIPYSSWGVEESGTGITRLLISHTTGNVGIGTASPDNKLHLYSNNSSADALLKLEQDGTGDASIDFLLTSTNLFRIGVDHSNNDALTFAGGSFGTGLDYMVIRSGNVGIGTTSPDTKLEVADTTPTLRLTDTRNLNVGDWDDVSLGKLQFKTSDTSSPGARVLSEIEAYSGPAAASAPESQLRFKTATNSDTSATTKMTISATGNVGIGTTTPNHKLSVAGGNIEVNNGGATWFGSDATGGFARTFNGNSFRFISSANSETMRIDNATGNVGIGTTSPSRLLDVDGVQGWSAGNVEKAYMNPTSTGTDFNLFGNNGNIRFDSRAGSNSYINTGNVGIGTTSPSEKLHIADIDDVNIYLESTDTTVAVGQSYGGLIWKSNDSSGIGARDTGRIQLIGAGSVAESDMLFFTTDYNVAMSEKMRITSSGNVGIGTTNPSRKLEVSDGFISTTNPGANGGFELKRDGLDTYQLRHIDGGLTVFNATDSRKEMSFAGTGDVGIGTTTPTQLLHVAGNIRVTGKYYDSSNSSGTAGQILSATLTGTDWIDNAHIPSPAPATPGSIVSTVVGQTIEIAFNQSATANIDYYQVWSSDDGGDYGIIAQIPPTDFSATMTVVDTSFSTGGTMSYRVYAVKSGVYSSPGTTSKTYTVGTLDVTDMTVINLNTAYYIQYEKPASRFIDHIEIYMDSQTTQGALNRSNASIIYSGQNTSFMKSVGVSNNFHQFWVEVVTT
jgi:hypothetical protein